MAIIAAQDLRLSYTGVDMVLDGVNLTLHEGQVVALEGPSGSGKSSLLYCLAGLLKPTSGKITAFGKEFGKLSEDGLAKLRRDHFGFVFQFAELVPELTLLDNAALPLRLRGEWNRTAKKELLGLFDRLGIADQATSRPAQVSGGQAQRAAVARAIFCRPKVIFADEPTGSLDGENASNVLDLFLSLSVEIGASVVLVTHDPQVAAAADVRLAMFNGQVVGQQRVAP